MALIQNGSNVPLNAQQGTVPNVSGAMFDWFQQCTFVVVSKSVSAFQVVEVGESVEFWGVVQPLTGRKLEIKPEGQRNWNWIWIHSQVQLPLTTDDVIQYLGIQYRVMSQKNFSIYGYYEYELVEDYTGAGPEIA